MPAAISSQLCAKAGAHLTTASVRCRKGPSEQPRGKYRSVQASAKTRKSVVRAVAEPSRLGDSPIGDLGNKLSEVMGQKQSKVSESGFDHKAYQAEAPKDALAQVSLEIARELGAEGKIHKLVKRTWRTPATATDPETIQVGPEFNAEPGEELGNGLKLGKQIGDGMQGAIFLLEDKDGKDAGRVFKQVKMKPVAEATGNLVGLEREWVVGRQLNTLREEDGFLPGFMQTGSKIVDADGSFSGMILELLNGKDIIKRFDDPKFNDIFYVREMSVQVLMALERAQKGIGFKHRDMRVENIMEHRLLPPGQEERKDEGDEDVFGKKVDLRGLHFKIIDYGHAIVTADEVRNKEIRRKIRRFRMPAIPAWSLEWSYRWIFKERGDVWRFTRSLARDLEGRTWLKQDEAEVRQVLALIKKIAGLRVNAKFANSFESGERKKNPVEKLLSFGGQLFHIQWLHLTLRAYFFPGHPTITPAKALEYWNAMPKDLIHGSGPKGPAVSEEQPDMHLNIYKNEA